MIRRQRYVQKNIKQHRGVMTAASVWLCGRCFAHFFSEMTRTYQVKYKSKSKMLTTPEKVEDTKKTILEVPRVKSVEIKDDGQIVSIEVEKEEDFEEVMNRVVNVFRRIDDKSEVSYKFALNA